MNDQSTHLVRAVTGPIILITIGVLFAFDRFTDFRFSETWPILLIVVGLLKLIGGSRRYRFPGDLGRHDQPPANQPPVSGSNQSAAANYQGPGSYQGSQYQGPGTRP